MAQSAFSPDAWTRARNRFLEDLTDEEQVRMAQSVSLLLDIKLEGPRLPASNPEFIPRH